MRTVLDCAPSPEAGCPGRRPSCSGSASTSAARSRTSCFLDEGGRLHTKKVSSSVDDYARAIVDGLGEVFRDTGIVGRGHRRGAPRHHRRVERHPRAEGRAHRAHHDPRASATSSRSAGSGCRGSTTSRGRSRRRSSSATCARRSPSASTRTAPSRRRSPWPRSSEALERLRRRGRRGARRLPHQLLRQPGARGADQGASCSRRAPDLVGLLQRRGAAGDPGVRAHVDHGDQCVRDADRPPLPGHAADRPRRRGRDDAAPDHAVQRRAHDRRGRRRRTRSTSSSPARRPASSARRRSRGGSGSASSSRSTWAAPPRRRRSSRTAR